MKILLGGIPLGYDNIGDEAILTCVVRMLKEAMPDVEITVATADAGTADLLGVATVLPYGFADAPLSKSGNADDFAKIIRQHDAYIWCGATGLSDYPNVALDLLEIAQNAGISSFIWGVGMDDELNPVFFKAHGKRLMVLNFLGLTNWYECRLKNILKKRIAKLLPRCKGVWLRDPQSVAVLSTMGFEQAGVTADSAILFRPSQTVKPPVATKKLGLCISTQRQVTDLEGVKQMIEEVRRSGAKVIGIPMNPKTDKRLLERLGVECIEGTTPDAAIKAAAECDAVLSSRLHLLILAANAGTPILGIARGSKLENWLSNFGRTVEGSIYDCDWKKVTRHVLQQLDDKGDWDERRQQAYDLLMKRLQKAKDDFIGRLKK